MDNSSGHSGRFGHEFLGEFEVFFFFFSPIFLLFCCLTLCSLQHGEDQLTLGIFKSFDFRVIGDGRSAVARYANNSNYRNDSLIRKESMFCSLSF